MYAGLTYRRWGAPVLAVSNLARQDSKIKPKLAAYGIELLSGKSMQTTHFVNRHQGSHCHQMMTQTARTIDVKQIQPIVDVVDGLHLGPLHPLDIDPQAYSMLRNSNQKIFLDVQGLTRRVVHRQVLRGVSSHLAAGLQTAHIIKANGGECQAILDFYQLNLSEFVQSFHIDEFVVTLGGGGGFVQTRKGDKIDYDAVSFGMNGDPTGAGDVFFAAYIYNRFVNQVQICEACRSAARIAARQVAGTYISYRQLNPLVA
jgi:sugar/nucleoside kinase (ribokinase family)